MSYYKYTIRRVDDSSIEAFLDMLYEARESEDIGSAVLEKFEAALHQMGIEYDEEG